MPSSPASPSPPASPVPPPPPCDSSVSTYSLRFNSMVPSMVFSSLEEEVEEEGSSWVIVRTRGHGRRKLAEDIESRSGMIRV